MYNEEEAACVICAYEGDGDLRIDVLSQEKVEVVKVTKNKTFFVPESIQGVTVITYQGKAPVFGVSEIQGNWLVIMPEDTTFLVEFISESRGRLCKKKKIFTSIY